MKTKLYITIGTLVTSSLLALSSYAAEPSTEHSTEGHDPMTLALSKKSGKEFEPAFLEMMIHHHQGAMDMAKLVDSRADSAELKKMATEMISTQGKEITQMTDWLKQWHSKSPQDHKEPEASKQMMEKTMAKLKAAKGTEFDHHFSEEMAAHHQSGVAMAHLAVTRADHAEVKSLAETIMKMQTEERTKLLKLAGHE